MSPISPRRTIVSLFPPFESTRYVKQKIALAPNNPSAWNYLRGVLTKTSTPFSSVETFVKPYTVPQLGDILKETVIDVENPLPGEAAELPCTEALEFLADVCEKRGNEESVDAAVEVHCIFPSSWESS